MPEATVRKDVVVKGTRNGLVVVLDDGMDFESAKAALIERLSERGSFFQGASIILDIGGRDVAAGDLVEMGLLMEKKLGVHLDKVVRNRYRGFRTGAGDDAEYGGAACPGAEQPTTEGPVGESAPAPHTPAGGSRSTLLVKRTVRSGQTLAYDGNIVVLGDVNAGAELVAAGDIVVVGALRGVAHAGAGGDEGAIVAALSLAPVQLRIAGRICRPPEGQPRPAFPEVARLQGGTIVVEAMSWIPGASRASGGEE